MYNKEAEASLYYLYMSADGQKTYSEEKVFSKICDELSLDETQKEDVIRKCKELLAYSKDVKDIIEMEKIDENAKKGWILDRPKSELAGIIWNLINLGYSDQYFSQPEKEIVQELAKKWDISSQVYHEFIDISETMLSLTEQRNWAYSHSVNMESYERAERQCDEDMATLLNDVNLTIQELAM